MKQKIVVSNVRFPYEDWMIVKSMASDMNMSINEYIQYTCRADSVKKITGVKKMKRKPRGYAAMDEFLKFASTHKGKPMGASEDDKAIYDIE